MSSEKLKPNKETSETHAYEAQNATNVDERSPYQTSGNVKATPKLANPRLNSESFNLAERLTNNKAMSDIDQCSNETNSVHSEHEDNKCLKVENPDLETDRDILDCFIKSGVSDNVTLQEQGNRFSGSSDQNTERRSSNISAYLSKRQSKKEIIKQKLSDGRGPDMSSKILEEYYEEFCKEGQTPTTSKKNSVENNHNQNNNDNDTNALTTSDSVGEAIVLDSDDVSDLEIDRSRMYRSKVKRRTSSTIRKIQEMIQEEQLKDLRGRGFNGGNLPNYSMNKVAGLPFKTTYRQRSKSRQKFAKVSNDQAYRPFRRWLGVSTCVASDTRFIVQPGKEHQQKRNGDKIGFENNVHDSISDRNFLQIENETIEELAPCSSAFEKLNQTGEFKIKGSIVFGKEKTISQSKMCPLHGKCKDIHEADVATEPVIKIINRENGAESDKCKENGCECTSKQIVNVEGNEGVIHIHQQSHGTVGKMRNKAGSSNRDSTGNTSGLANNSDDESKASTFKSLRKKLKNTQKKRKYINVQAVMDCEGTFPGQLSFKKGQMIKQMKTSQNTVEGMCYGYYRAGKLQRKVWGIYPSSHVVQTNGKQEEINNDAGVTDMSENK